DNISADTNVTIRYTVVANGSCGSTQADVTFTVKNNPQIPIVSLATQPSCTTEGTSIISNYIGTNTYVFTPSGPTVDATGLVSGMVFGTSYTVTSNSAGCSSAASTSFTNAAAICAKDDAFTIVGINEIANAGNVLIGNPTTPDTFNGSPVTIGLVNLAVITPATPLSQDSPVPNIDITSGQVNVPSNTPAGTYKLIYRICEILNPSNCDTATVTVVVKAATIIANDDMGSLVGGFLGGKALSNVLANDTLNGTPIIETNVKTTFVSSTNEGITLSGTEVMVAAGTPAGTYTLTYSICEKSNPTNCSQATVSVTVTKNTNAHAIVTGSDTISINGYIGGTALVNVLANDKLNENDINASEIILTAIDIPAGIILKNDGTINIMPGMAGGKYTLTYQICEIANSSNCTTGTVTIFVETPSIALIETVVLNDSNGNGYAEAGETLTYRYVVTNTGNTDLKNISVSDLLPGMIISGGPINLAIGESDNYSFIGSYILSQADINSGRVTSQGTVSAITTSGIPLLDKSDPVNLVGNDPTVFDLSGCIIKVFNAVSPNGDGMNDRFYIQGLECYTDNTVSIFNRWGVLVFERDHYNNTDIVFVGLSEGRSTIKNSDGLPEGTYYYVIKYKDSKSNPHQEVGYLYLSK
ncbi:gliding motility-associated C-terminal domain-containing protein, partial [Flavobacterium granuli]